MRASTCGSSQARRSGGEFKSAMVVGRTPARTWEGDDTDMWGRAVSERREGMAWRGTAENWAACWAEAERRGRPRKGRTGRAERREARG